MSGTHLATAAGFHGKIPALGDFVGRGLPASFVDPFDTWLRTSLAASRARLGDAWEDNYLTSPLWSFAVAAGFCGPAAAIGVLIPSVDRVGRYFPFAVVASIPNAVPPWPLLGTSRTWLDRAGELALTVLGDAFELARFESEIIALGSPAVRASAPSFELGVAAKEASPLLEALAAAAPVGSVWSTDGGAGRAPAILVFAGMPPAEAFSALLDGHLAACGILELTT